MKNPHYGSAGSQYNSSIASLARQIKSSSGARGGKSFKSPYASNVINKSKPQTNQNFYKVGYQQALIHDRKMGESYISAASNFEEIENQFNERLKNVEKLVEQDKFDFIDNTWLDDPAFINNGISNENKNKLGKSEASLQDYQNRLKESRITSKISPTNEKKAANTSGTFKFSKYSVKNTNSSVEMPDNAGKKSLKIQSENIVGIKNEDQHKTKKTQQNDKAGDAMSLLKRMETFCKKIQRSYRHFKYIKLNAFFIEKYKKLFAWINDERKLMITVFVDAINNKVFNAFMSVLDLTSYHSYQKDFQVKDVFGTQPVEMSFISNRKTVIYNYFNKLMGEDNNAVVQNTVSKGEAARTAKKDEIEEENYENEFEDYDDENNFNEVLDSQPSIKQQMTAPVNNKVVNLNQKQENSVISDIYSFESDPDKVEYDFRIQNNNYEQKSDSNNLVNNKSNNDGHKEYKNEESVRSIKTENILGQDDDEFLY